MYCATKHAVTALTDGLRQELVKQKTKIRVTVSKTQAFCACKRSDVASTILLSTLLMLQSLSPGLVETEMAPEEFLKRSPLLNPEDIAAGVLYVLGAPPHVQVRAVCDVMFTAIFPRSFHITPWSRVSLEKLTFAKMVKFHCLSQNSPPPVPNHSHINPLYAFHPHLHLNLGAGLQAGTFQQVFQQKSRLPLECLMPSPSYPSFLFGYTNGVRRGIQLIIQVCVFCTTRNNFLPNQDKHRRSTPCRQCATV